jgi:hypothetical protein
MFMRSVSVGAATVTAPASIDIVHGATSSGDVELTTTSTQPTNTGITIEVAEDTDNDSTAEFTQSKSISAGTDVVTVYDQLSGAENDGYHYYLDITLTSSDGVDTPTLDSATLTLPATNTTPEPTQTPISEPEEPQGAGELWNNYRAFVAGVVLAFATIGLWAKSLAVGAFVAYMAFAYLAVTTGTVLFETILYVTIILVFLGMAFKLWRLELGGE